MRIARVFTACFLISCFLLTMTSTGSASMLDDFYADKNESICRWEFEGDHSHMGTKNDTYSFLNDDIRNAYYTAATNGFAMWHDNIVLTEIIIDDDHPIGGDGTIMTINDPNDWAAARTPCQRDPVTNHRTTWQIVINIPAWNQKSPATQQRTMAHEIGHPYGLGHCGEAYYGVQIMGCESETKDVTEYDEHGMSVCTHEHSFTSNPPHGNWTLFQSYTTGQHKNHCGICGGYVLENHNWGPWSDNTGHNNHIHTCGDCNVTGTASHTYLATWVSFSTTQHRHMCTAIGCEYYAYADHAYPTTWEYYSTTQHTHECSALGCGYDKYANHVYGST